MALSRVPVPLTGGIGTTMRHSSLHYFITLRKSALCRVIFQASSSLRSFNRKRLGEERIRGLVHGFSTFCLMAFCLTASYAAAETPASAVEDISAIIRTEIMSMPEWRDADIRIEITGEIKRVDFHAPGEIFRIAPEGLTVTRRNVLAPIEVVRDGKTIRSFWVPAVVHASMSAVSASRKIVSGKTITEEDIVENRVETTDTGVVFVRNPQEILGKTARRPFAAGEPLPLEAFSEPVLIRKGEMVNVRLNRGKIMLTSTAQAAENGRLGEVIRIKSVDFSSVIRARVTGRAEGSVQ
jgi:flagella basal body P-ring formation protein FlgA